jgi:hypothetical protein
MTFWQFFDRTLARLPGWPSERQVVTFINVFLIWIMLRMARENGTLWDVEVFKVVFQALVLTGFLNMAMAFFFAANKSDEAKAENTGKMADAMKEVAKASTAAGEDGAARAAVQVADAAADEADFITRKTS